MAFGFSTSLFLIGNSVENYFLQFELCPWWESPCLRQCPGASWFSAGSGDVPGGGSGLWERKAESARTPSLRLYSISGPPVSGDAVGREPELGGQDRSVS